MTLVKSGIAAPPGTRRHPGPRKRAPAVPAPTRKERALETRRRILRAAYGLFCKFGYAATTMDAIAKEASVAVQTLYFTFRTKGAILGETLGAAIIGFDRFTPQPADFDAAEAPKVLMAWWPAFAAEPDPKKALALYMEQNGVIMSRAAPLMRVMQAATGDPAVDAVASLGEQRRVDSYCEVVKFLGKKRKLKVSLARATDVLLALASPALFLELTLGRGWSLAEHDRFVLELVAREILEPDSRVLK